MNNELTKAIQDLTTAINNTEALRLQALDKRMDVLKRDVLRIVEEASKEENETKVSQEKR